MPVLICDQTKARLDNKIAVNTGSCIDMAFYLDKQEGRFYSYDETDIRTYEVIESIDSNRQGLNKNNGKWFSGSINPTPKEWESYGKTDEERKGKLINLCRKDLTEVIAENFGKRTHRGEKREVKPEDLNIYYKFHENRYYRGTDDKVKKGLVKSKDVKEESNQHVHFIIGAKSKDNKLKIALDNNNPNQQSHNSLKIKFEQRHDQITGYKRNIEERYEYLNTMKNGTYKEKTEMLERLEREQKQILKLTQEQNIKKQQQLGINKILHR